MSLPPKLPRNSNSSCVLCRDLRVSPSSTLAAPSFGSDDSLWLPIVNEARTTKRRLYRQMILSVLTECLVKRDQARGRVTTSRNESLNGQVLVIFMVSALSMLRTAIWGASQIILFQVYGRERATREHLQLVKFKPKLVVSNGDVLWGRGFEHYLIGMAIWLPSTILILLVAWKLLPKAYHDAMQLGTYAGWAILLAIFLFFGANFLSLKLTLITAAVVLAVVIGPARLSVRADGQNITG
jgi:hypothetical protein